MPDLPDCQRPLWVEAVISLMPGAHQSPGDISAHPANADQSNLHYSILQASGRVGDRRLLAADGGEQVVERFGEGRDAFAD